MWMNCHLLISTYSMRDGKKMEEKSHIFWQYCNSAIVYDPAYKSVKENIAIWEGETERERDKTCQGLVNLSQHFCSKIQAKVTWDVTRDMNLCYSKYQQPLVWVRWGSSSPGQSVSICGKQSSGMHQPVCVRFSSNNITSMMHVHPKHDIIFKRRFMTLPQ